MLIRKFDSHVALDSDDKDALAALPHRVREMSENSYIFRERATPGECAVLLEGFAFRQKLNRDGERQIVSLHIPGDPLNLQSLLLDRADHGVQALTHAKVAMIPRSAMRQLALDRPNIATAFEISNLIEASILREWLMNVGQRNAQTRIAHLLCEIATRLKDRDLLGHYEVELPMTQKQVGDVTGLTAVHVNRSLKALEVEGSIERYRRAIRCPNWEELVRVADFSDSYLHLGRQAAAC